MQFLQNRVFRSSCSTRPLTGPTVNERPAEYKIWSTEQMEQACGEVTKGTLYVCTPSCRGIHGSYKYTIGQSYWQDSSHSGPARYLSDEEEAELVHFLVGSAQI